MATHDDLIPKAPWRAIHVTDGDWDAADPALLGTMLTELHLIRAFEEKVLELAAQGLVHGPAHSSVGQEGGAVGSILPLRSSDHINGSHRGHHQFLAKSLVHLAPQMEPRATFGEPVRELMQKTLAEICGLAQGYCKGRGGSMHLRWLEAGNLGTNAIVGGGAPLAAGSAWAHRHAGTADVAVNYLGDGAVNIGSVLEAMNIAAAWKLPLCFFIENNAYAVSTHVDEVTAEPRLSSRGLAFGIPSWKVDGMNPLAVHLAMEEALAVMRSGDGPTIIEADCYRYFHQNGALPGSAFGYRSKEEEASWRARDPLEMVAAKMQQRQLTGEDEVAALRSRCLTLMDDVAAELLEKVDGKTRIIPALWPPAEFRDVGIRGDLSEFDGVRYEELESFAGAIVEDEKYIKTVADVMHRRMSQDPRIVIMGEDIHRLKGGTNGATRGLSTEFPGRVLGTPISENAFCGLAGGIAMDGRFLPVVELMYPDFLWVAADQIFNQIAKARHMFGGESDMPLVMRMKIAMGTGYGSQHSMDPAGIFATSVGWRVVAPSTPFDYVGLMNSALLCRDPVLVIEHVDLYNGKGPAPADDLDYFIPLGKAKVVRPGTAMTILTYSAMVAPTLAEVEASGFDAEVIDLRSLDRAGLDWETIEASVRKTNNILIVEQGSIGTSYGGMLADEAQRRLFDWLDQPIQRVHGGEASPSISKILETAACAGKDEIADGLRRVMRDQGRLIAAE
ncbi:MULTISPECIES: alpha-ketoacid dehydrogenase subunit alpha/beta [unclassified Sphingomonas]|uniref:alpha-ketoacid dehydrogenase subunit alpha/beta n=1 Tax=unclassified Sphingomonas TaxID=196159 RepID=UPI00070126F7|nr:MULTISPECIES: alpha-ketoacid dehydrogenase subunit alpha/beta [unclassified Sphingomonas]KQX23518.1 MFS transporter [Sphingomonas sp. Root1294]KQY68368.1 MFS transporter [Sphingomonas sp. Root50]KRB91271.1 MFS transporter [Sphingomonas sp. Root720]